MKKFNLYQTGWGFIAILVLIILRATNPIVIKFALNASWPPFLLGFLRMAIIGVIIGTWCWMLGESILGRDQKGRCYSFVASLCKGISVILFYMALAKIPANRVVVISSISPIINLILVHLLLPDEKITGKRLTGIFISFTGMIFLLAIRDKSNVLLDGTNHSLIGDILTTGNVVFLQGMFVYEKKALNRGIKPRQLLNASNIFSLIAFAICLLFRTEGLTEIPLTLPSISSFLYLISLTGVFLFYYRRWLASKLDVSYISSFFYLEKTFAVLFAVLILHENISILSIFSFGFILTGTFIAGRYS